MSNKEIKEICITTSHVFYKFVNDSEVYNDILRISRNRISYKRYYFLDNQILNFWDYSTSSDIFTTNYDELCTHIQSITMPYMRVTDCGSFKIEIIYTNMTTDVFEYDSDFHFNQMDFISYLIKKLIPVGELYSDLLDYDDLANLDY